VTRRRWFPLLAVGLAAAATLLVSYLLRERPHDESWGGIWRPREVRGVVLAGGRPVPGAIVDIYESPSERGRTVAGADGRFHLTWHPRLGNTLFLRARDEGGLYAPTVAEAGAGETTIDLVQAVMSRGIVLTTAGEPVAGARVAAAPQGGLEARTATTGPDGKFFLAGLPEGRPLDLVLGGDGLQPYLERRYKGGDAMVLRAFPGTKIRLEAVDPHGLAVLGTKVSMILPEVLRPHAPPVGCDSAGSLVNVEAPGYLPVRAEVVAHRRTRVILWPKRTVSLRVGDPVRRRGVPAITIDQDIRPASGAWRLGHGDGALRPIPIRRGARGGEYLVDFPVCAIDLHLSAPGYNDVSLSLAADADRKLVSMRPLARRLGGTLQLLATNAPDGFPLVVADLTGRWNRILRLVHGRASIEVPPGKQVQVASLGAYGGFWLPKVDFRAPRRGEKKRAVLSLLPANKIILALDPPVDGNASLTDLHFQKLERPLRARVENGRGVLWARPKRNVRVDITTPTNHFPVAFEIHSDQPERTWEVRLRPAAAAEFRILDPRGRPIAFALTSLWEPARGGRMELRAHPRRIESEPTGRVFFRALRAGDAAVEFRAEGFRTRLISLLKLEEGKIADGGEIRLIPTGRFSGRLVDSENKPVAGAWLKVLEPMVARLPLPGGLEFDLYDLTSGKESGEAATNSEGRFAVPDASARAPLIACFPVGRDDLADSVLFPDQLRAGGDRRIPEVAYLEIELPRSVRGVYQLWHDQGRAVLLAIDPPMALRPLPVKVAAGRLDLFVRLLDQRWGAVELHLKPGETRRVSLSWNQPER